MVEQKNKLSDCASRVPGSGTLRMAALAKEMESQGRKIIKLGIGEPNFNTPIEIIEAAYKAMLDGKTGYTPSKGIAPLLEKIAQIHSVETGVELNPKENIIVTPGAKASLFAGIVSILNPGDNLIVISPYWPSYDGIAKFVGAETKSVHAHYGDFEFPFETIKEAIDKKTKILLINSPSNPTGAIYELDALKFINDISHDHNLTIISDEIYKKIIFEGNYQQYLAVSQTLDRTLIIDGLSKSHAMTGWRFGYGIGSKDLITAMDKIQQNVNTCVNAPTQYAALKALDLDAPTKMMVVEYKERRDKAMELIDQCDYLSCRKPEGAFYLFIKYKGDIPSNEFVLKILQEKGVSVTDGLTFGVKENYIRLSLASELVDILEGIRRINDLLIIINKK
ncbi:MAG: pyridoxal phosphate-dependent aminotransferase [Candidatus Heimdallarchaeota archaeon]|nr:pyridoxal phosphate-dependent aminotransferase [Candidatus Heimdallarchaeota archaeon]